MPATSKSKPKSRSSKPRAAPRKRAVGKKSAKAAAKPTTAKPRTAPKPASRALAKASSVDWRVATLGRMRALIFEADPEIVEEVKWRKPSNEMQGVPAWSKGGILCTGETYKDKVKLTFAKGASLPDPTGLFNGKDNGATRRSIDLFEGQDVDAKAFTALVRNAISLNIG